MGTYTTNLDLYKPTVGEQGWGNLVNDNFDKIDSTIIVGVIQLFAGSSAPNGWLICNGQAVSRTTYAALFAVIGTTYGSGDGSTTFNIPNLVNKTVRGSNSLGKTGGSDTVTLATTNMPAHTHGGGSLSAASAGAHTHSAGTYAAASAGAHTHTTPWSAYQSSGGWSGWQSNSWTVKSSTTTSSAGAHTHSLSGSSASAGAHTHTVSGTTGSTGSGSAVTITNPYVMLHYIIKT